MISLIINYLKCSKERRFAMYRQLLIEECNYYNGELRQMYKRNLFCALALPNVAGTDNSLNDNQQHSKNYNRCRKEIGMITSIQNGVGIIDMAIFFDMALAADFTENDICRGAYIEYLYYNDPINGNAIVLKIERVLVQNKIENLPSDELGILKRIGEMKRNLQLEPDYESKIMGVIIEVTAAQICMETDYGKLLVNMIKVQCSFVPEIGDYFTALCLMRNISDVKQANVYTKQIANVIRIFPTRILYNQTYVVKHIFKNSCTLNTDIYLAFNILENEQNINLGDAVLVDIIESEQTECKWRCINVISIGSRESLLWYKNSSLPVHISGDYNRITTTLGSIHMVIFICTNNWRTKLRVLSIKLCNTSSIADVRILSQITDGYVLEPKEQQTIIMEIVPKTCGHFFQHFVLNFQRFAIRRGIPITISSVNNADTLNNMPTNNALIDAKPSKYLLQQGNADRYHNHEVCNKRYNIRNFDVISSSRSYGLKRLNEFRIIAQYPLPEGLRSTYIKHSMENKSLRNYENAFPILTEPLTFQNYITRFDTFINFEESEFYLLFSSYDMERACLTRHGDYLYLEIPHLDERRPHLCIGDTVYATDPYKHADNSGAFAYEAKIQKIVENKVYLKFNMEFVRSFNNQYYRLQFHYSRFIYRKQKLGIRLVAKQLGENFLFPITIKFRHQQHLPIHLDANCNLLLANKVQSWFDSQLNDIQKRAIYNVLRGERFNMPYIIFGPPGTGKTKTLIEIVLQVVHLLPTARMLIAAPSNSAVTLIATHLIRNSIIKDGDLVYVVGQNQMERGLVPEHLLPYATTCEIGLGNTNNQSKFLGKHRITIGTLATLGNLLLLNLSRDHFTHVFIDECGRASEPDVMQIICQVSKLNGHVVLLGDHRQLDAVIINRYDNAARSIGSYLERLQSNPLYKCNLRKYPNTSGYNPLLITKLLKSYRALPSICNMYSTLFYESELTPMISDIYSPNVRLLMQLSDLLPKSTANTQRAHGVYFNGVDGVEYKVPNSPSWCNPMEATKVFVMAAQLYKKNISADDIGIITMYSKQVHYISGLFNAIGIKPPKIGTVEEYQGQEREIILISTVRTMKSFTDSDANITHADFIYNAKRMNVAISRARTLLIVFGHTDLLCRDKNWQIFVQYCKDNDAYWGYDVAPSAEPLTEIETETNTSFAIIHHRF